MKDFFQETAEFSTGKIKRHNQPAYHTIFIQQDELLLLSPPKHLALFEQQPLLYRAPTLKNREQIQPAAWGDYQKLSGKMMTTQEHLELQILPKNKFSWFVITHIHTHTQS